jgi:1-acyl-sn-glycerol-3-phosphate acyltransferase
MLAISWFWFYGAIYLAQLPAFTQQVLHGNAHVFTLLLALFSIGIGSLLCETLSRRHVEIGLVPLGAIGMSVFAIDLYLASRALPPLPIQHVGEFAARPAHWRVMIDLGLLALFAGLYSVPMYALIQLRAQPSHRSRIIAANNILNAIFMIVSSLAAGALLSAGFSVPEVFLATGLLNAAVAIYIFLLVPEYLLRFVALVLSRCVYRLRVAGDEHIPVSGPAVVVANHVSFVDAILLMAASPRPIRFVMDHRIFAVPVLGWLFRLAKAIPIAPEREHPQIYREAFEAADRVLADGDLLGIFPEGGITRDGELQPFKGGVMKVLERRPVPVVPVGLQNLWGSYFSRVDGSAMTKPFRRGLFNRVSLIAGDAMPASEVTPEGLRARVAHLLAA